MKNRKSSHVENPFEKKLPLQIFDNLLEGGGGARIAIDIITFSRNSFLFPPQCEKNFELSE